MLATLARIWYERSAAPTPPQTPFPRSPSALLRRRRGGHLHAVKTLQDDVAAFPATYEDLPGGTGRRRFHQCLPRHRPSGVRQRALPGRARMVNASAHMVSLVRNPFDGLDAAIRRPRATWCSPCSRPFSPWTARARARRRTGRMPGTAGPARSDELLAGLRASPLRAPRTPAPTWPTTSRSPSTPTRQAMRDPRNPVLNLIGAVAHRPH